MWSFTKKEGLSPDRIEELKNQWFSMEEAIEELAVNGEKLAESTFRRRANQVNRDKDFFEIGKPQIKEEKGEGKGRPKKIYNRAFIEALRSIAISDTYIQVEEQPIDFFISSDWKEVIEEEFKETLNDFNINQKDIYEIVQELSRNVGETIIQKYNAIIGQNKFLVHQNKKLEDTKEYYIALYRGVEENANVLTDIAKFIKDDISESSALLSRKEVMHMKQTINVNKKLEEILDLLQNTKVNDK